MSQPTESPRRVLFLLSSAREQGNAEQLARSAAKALPANTQVDWVRLDSLQREPFLDLRHTPGGYSAPGPIASALAESTLAADEIVFVAPVYWYSLPAPAKLYLDHWSWWMRRPELRFRERMAGKVLSLITAHSSEDDEGAEQPSILTLKLSADYLGMRWRGALIGHGSKPGEVMQDAPALEAAGRFLVQPVS
ncbi:NAD(P)H-dependent oxidoreductase [Myxococcaceae bacterium JPH2]|nr:NAD(P)H-dependent oxidoreductase [Myxococcaceae bacterium JPH2]